MMFDRIWMQRQWLIIGKWEPRHYWEDSYFMRNMPKDSCVLGNLIVIIIMILFMN